MNEERPDETGSVYDLGHFRMHGGETLPIEALPYLVTRRLSEHK